MDPNIAQIFAMTGIRGLSPMGKAVALVVHHEISQHKAADSCGVDRCALQRAIKAHHKGRDFGIAGRPTILKEVQENQVIDLINETSQLKGGVTMNQAAGMVRKCCDSSHFSILIYFET
jgi:hypothetical protein